ncbi:K02A2.6-like [Cordylochernes scorpioides]|uniref:K02A2.6-like n=1 Tax=Cordylochernes scorpioides TaxID=51811 RepID=A0ABY6LTR2_9ARAC|nr:K02A2.6-like [Cordylochernes scorpioides]
MTASRFLEPRTEITNYQYGFRRTIHEQYVFDHCGQFFLKWPEVIGMNSTTTQNTIKVLREIFSRYGIPEQVVTDKGSFRASPSSANYRDVSQGWWKRWASRGIAPGCSEAGALNRPGIQEKWQMEMEAEGP